LLCPKDYDHLKSQSSDKLVGNCSLSEGQTLNVWIVETVVTFIFATLVLNIKYHYGHNKAIVNCLIVGLSLSSLVGISAGITGGCINPAIGLV
jgi:glycerol uptake facilitator-like aquaporin